MAKKKQTMEELLAAALVPEEEQRYKIPSNWEWTSLGNITNIIGGGTPKSNTEEYYKDGDIPWITPADLSNYNEMFIGEGKKSITQLGLAKSSAKLVPKNTVLMSSRAPIGYVALAEKELTTNQGFKSFVPSKSYYPQFLYYYLIFSKNYLESRASGSTFKELSASKAKEIPFPLPPLNEQKRIADKVERLLNNIDEAKQLIEEAKESFELRRAAILDMAFRGELTRDWRTKNKITDLKEENSSIEEPYELPNSWSWVTIRDVTNFVGSGSTPKGGSSIYQESGIPFIRSQNVLRNKMSIDDIVFIREDVHEKMKRTQLNGHETLLNITGASIGRATKIEKKLVPSNVNQHVCALRFNDKVIEDLPQFWLNSPFLQKEINKMQIGMTRQALNFPQVKSLLIPLIPRDEQIELLSKIEKLELKEEKIDSLVLQLEQLNALKQSILSKAFKGELGTNDPLEENAIELLKEVLETK